MILGKTIAGKKRFRVAGLTAVSESCVPVELEHDPCEASSS
jgi:hypothetical protein